jgi:hypothetical protein
MSDNDLRAKQKQKSRERDEARLKSGELSLDELKQQNNFFSAVPVKRFKIMAIGNKPLKPRI